MDYPGAVVWGLAWLGFFGVMIAVQAVIEHRQNVREVSERLRRIGADR